MSPLLEVQEIAGALDRCEISREDFVERCAELMTKAIDCGRAGIWVFDESEHGPVARCLGLYDRDRGTMVSVPSARDARVDAYFEALARDGYVMADDIDAHPATRGLLDHVGNVNRIRSLLAAAFMFNGSLFGAFTCSAVAQPRHWTRSELVTLMRIGNRATLALSGASRTRPASLPMPL